MLCRFGSDDVFISKPDNAQMGQRSGVLIRRQPISWADQSPVDKL